jgi:hypothetical protein
MRYKQWFKAGLWTSRLFKSLVYFLISLGPKCVAVVLALVS